MVVLRAKNQMQFTCTLLYSDTAHALILSNPFQHIGSDRVSQPWYQPPNSAHACVASVPRLLDAVQMDGPRAAFVALYSTPVI